MFTVVISEQEHIDSLRQFDIFLKPFIDNERIVFCRWHPEGQTFVEMVPDLSAIVGRRTEWRTVVLCDEGGLDQRNPFDRVRFKAPERLEGEEEKDYLMRLRQAKFRAYDEAARLPLPRLMTFLCQLPIISTGRDDAGEDDGAAETEDDIELSRRRAEEGFRLLRAEHRAEAAYKQERRRQILGDETIDFALPTEICCIAKRTFCEQESDIRAMWDTHVDYQYSRFYDWNLYFERMRYLVYDILPQNHQGYTYNYLEYLYAVLLFAGHDLPAGSLRSDRVYCLECENDEESLRKLVVSYDEKLRATEERLDAEIQAIAAAPKPHLTNQEVAAAFCTPVDVPVNFDEETDRSGLFVDKKAFGLTNNCPSNEELTWEGAYLQAEDNVHRLMKQPRRSLKKAVSNFHAMDVVDTERAEYLDSFQMEDVEDFVNRAEEGLVSIRTVDLYDDTAFHKMMEKEDKAVRREMEKRMTRRMAVGLGAVVLTLYLVSMLPLLLGNTQTNVMLVLSLILAGVALVILALTGVVCLVCLRQGLKGCLDHFNGVMDGIVRQLESAMAQFSRYLGGVGGVMRGKAALTYFQEHEHSDVLQIRLRKKHKQDIRRCRAELQGVFGAFLTDASYADPLLTEPYDYDFARSVDFDYPVPYSEGTSRPIEFIQPGNSITVPVDFIKRITVRLEALYEQDGI